jgi:hypothetical protein
MRKIKMFSAGLVALALVAGFDGQAQQPSPMPTGAPPGSDRLVLPNGFPTVGTSNLQYFRSVSRRSRAALGVVSAYMPREILFSLPLKRYFSHHYLPPDGETSK